MCTELPEQYKSQIAFANGDAHPELGNRVAQLLGLEPIQFESRRFENTETYARFKESVRDRHVIAFQTHAPTNGYTVADAFLRHLQMIDAAVSGAAEKITAVAPNLAGARQDREVLPRESVSADLNLGLIRFAGASAFATVDIHDQHTLNTFRRTVSGVGTVNHYTAQPMLRAKLAEYIVDDPSAYVFLSPDEGHTKLLRLHANELGLEIFDMVKDRSSLEEKITHTGRLDGLKDRTCFIMDDIISTAGTASSAAHRAHEAGAQKIYIAATHGWFSGPALERLQAAPIDQIIVTDTLPIRQETIDALEDRLLILSADRVIAEGLNRTITGKSVSEAWHGQNYH